MKRREGRLLRAPVHTGDDHHATDSGFHAQFQDERTDHHLDEVLRYYHERFKINAAHIRAELPDGNARREAMRELRGELTRMRQIAPEVAMHRRRVEKEALEDDVSGLDSKKAFERMYEFALDTLKEGEKVVVIAFDLDKFKDINDTVGHVAADELLRKIGAAITEAIRSDDFATRIGGDEFMIILNRVKEDADVLQLIQRIGQKISEVTWTTRAGQAQGVTFSAGHTSVEFGQKPFFPDVRDAADRTSGYSKRLGRNRLTVIEGDRYKAYELQTQPDGTKQYVATEEGSVAVMDTPTEESCFKEVVSNGQRIAEEIERFFPNQGELQIFLVSKFKKTEPQDVHDLSDRQKAKVLLYVRSNGESEPTYWETQ